MPQKGTEEEIKLACTACGTETIQSHGWQLIRNSVMGTSPLGDDAAAGVGRPAPSTRRPDRVSV